MIETKHCSRKAAFAMVPMDFSPIAGVVSQTALLAASVTIPYQFQIVSVEAWCGTTAATISYDVQIGAVSVLAAPITPVAATKVAGVLSATLANIQGPKGGVINLKYTSNGTGTTTSPQIIVWIRPLGMKGDPVPMPGEQA